MSFGNKQTAPKQEEAPKAKCGPILTIRGEGGIAVAVWENEATKDGKSFVTHTFTPTRSFMNKEKKWQNIASFRKKDIPIVIACLQKAWEKAVLKDVADSDTESETE